MAQDPTTRVPQILTNTERRGTNARGNPGAQKNNFIRADWGTNDRYRGVMGQYLSVSWANNSEHPWVFSPLTATELSSVATFTDQAPATLDQFLLEPNNTEWNNASVVSEANNLLQKFIQDPGVNEGNPYYSFYLEEGMPAEYGSVAPVFNKPGDSFFDHTFAYLKPSEDMETRLTGGLEIEVEPVYNVFLDTMPPYESVTADVPEIILPNFYVFEAELRNTGSEAYTPDYYKMITLYAETGNSHRIEDWFLATDGGYTETNTKSYYQTYVTSLSAIKEEPSNYDALQSQFAATTKNVAVLNSDVNALNRLTRGDGETSGLSFLPFYNILRIGHDEYRATSGGAPKYSGGGFPTAESSFLANLYNVPNFDAESFIDILQMYIIQQLESGSLTPMNFAWRSGGSNMGALKNESSAPVLKCMYDSLSRADNPWNDGAAIEHLSHRIAYNASYGEDNVVLLRDYADQDRWTEDSSNKDVFDPPNPASVQEFYDKIATNEIVLPQRSWNAVVMNRGAFSETLLYKVDKYVVDASGNRSSTPAQTIYLSPRIVDGGDLQYIDSQVRYGVRYEYDIQQIRLVFGNRYSYDNLQVNFAGFAGYGRAVGNALGFYREPAELVKADNYVAKEVRIYYNPNNDIPGALTLNGYFAVDPTNAGDITGDEWDAYISSGSAFGEDEKLNRVNLTFKRGWGFEGNESGGAIGGSFNIPAYALPETDSAFAGLPGDQDIGIGQIPQLPPPQDTGPQLPFNPFAGGGYQPPLQETQGLFDMGERAGQMAAENILAGGIGGFGGMGSSPPTIPGLDLDLGIGGIGGFGGFGGGFGGFGNFGF